MLATAGGTEIRCAHFSDAQPPDDMLAVAWKQSFQAWISNARSGWWHSDQTFREEITVYICHTYKHTAGLRAQGDDPSASNSLLASGA